MNTLQKVFHNALSDVPHSYLAELINKKIKAQGINLSAQELKLLHDHVRNGKMNRFTINRSSQTQKTLSIDISEQESQGLLNRLETFYSDDLPEITEKLI